MGYAFKEVALSVRKVVHRIGVPLGACAMVRCVNDTIDDGIAEVHIGIGHIQLSAKHHATLNSLRSVHLVEQLKTLLYRTVTIRRSHTRCSGCALLFSYLLSSLLINISMSVLYHPNGKVPQLLKIIRSVINIAPLETQPMNIV